LTDKTDSLRGTLKSLHRITGIFKQADKNLSISSCVSDDTSCSISKSVSQQVVEGWENERRRRRPFSREWRDSG